jgi:hypothetical protein
MIVRIALLALAVLLVAHGANGLRPVFDGRQDAWPVGPAAEAVVGALGLLLLVFLSIRARRRAAAGFNQGGAASAQTAAAGDTEDETQKKLRAIASRPSMEFRRLMLVNLPPNAALSALESAPPLGAQESVRSALVRVLPGITFNDHGLGQFNAADHSILMDLGMAPEVWAATVDVTGEAAATALRRLITQTGWRAYAP